MRKHTLLLPAILLLASCGPTTPTTPPNPNPTPPITTPDPGPVPQPVQFQVSGPSTITTTAAQTWAVTTNNDAGVQQVQFFVDGDLVATDATAPFAYTASFTAAQNGPHRLTATLTDKAGNASNVDLQFTVNVQSTPEPGNPAPKPLFIPQPGAAVGSGDGTPLGTVYVSPNAQEVEFMHLLNEVRTKGTLNGQDVRAGTCLAGIQPGTLKPLTFNGVMAYAARKHSMYLGTWGYEGHYENNTNHPNFYGYTLGDRIRHAYSELGLGTPGMVSGGEIVTANSSTAYWAIKKFLDSTPHCNILKQNNINSIGLGFYDTGKAPYQNGSLTIFPNNWVALFGR